MQEIEIGLNSNINFREGENGVRSAQRIMVEGGCLKYKLNRS